MKICIISSYPPEKDGVGKFTQRLVKSLTLAGLNITVFTFNYKFVYKENNILQLLGCNPKLIYRTYKKLHNINPDIIHVQYATPVFRLYGVMLWILLGIYKKNHNVQVVVTNHEVTREIRLLGWLGVKYYSFISSVADQIIVHTKEASQSLITKCRVNKERVNIVPLGLYNDNFDTVINKSSSKFILRNVNTKTTVLFFGYIHIDKGIEYLIKALNLLYKQYPNYKKITQLKIAGDVRPRKSFFKLFEFVDYLYKTRLIHLTRSLSLQNNIKFLGYIQDQDIIPLIQSAKMLVMPYKRVEQSGVLNLALSLNVPIIASNIGGLEEMLGITKLTVCPKSPKDIMEKMHTLLSNNKFNTALFNKYRDIKKTHSLKLAVKKHLFIYENLNKEN